MPKRSTVSFFLWIFFSFGLLAQANLDQFKEALQKQSSHKSVQFKVLQTKILPALKAPVISKGTLWLIPQKKFRWDIGSPVKDKIIYDGQQVYFLDEKNHIGESLSPSNRRVKPILITLGIGDEASYEGLTKNFEVIKTRKIKNAIIVDLKPKSSKFQRFLVSLSLQTNTKTGLLERIEWLQKDESKVTTEFHSPVLNKALPQSIFEVIQNHYIW